MIDLKELFNRFTVGFVRPEKGVAGLVPKGVRVISMEALGDRPHRTRGRFTTGSIKDFKVYLEGHEMGSATALFIDPEKFAAEAVLNFGCSIPEWQDDKARLKADFTPLFKAINSLHSKSQAGNAITQKELLGFIDDWSEALNFTRENARLSAVSARAIFADLTVEKLRKARVSQSSHFERERSAAEKLSLGSSLPEFLALETPIINGLPARRILAQITAAEVGGVPAVELRIRGYVHLMEQEGKSFEELLCASGENSGYGVYVGAYSSGMQPKEVVGE